MSIIQLPDNISFTGNMKSFIISSATTVQFTLKDSGEIIIEATYEPDSNDSVCIDIKDLVESRLSYSLLHDNFYLQPEISKLFTAVIDGTSVDFTVLRCGVANLSDTPANWLKLNFLTWQLRNKSVTYYSPEWLTYFAVEAGEMKLKAYFQDGTEQLLSLGVCTAGSAYSANIQYAVVAGLLGKKYPSYYDVWVETTLGIKLSYIQRYYYSEPLSETEQWFMFENSLGGLDTARFYGDTDFDGNHEHKIALIDGQNKEYQVNTNRYYSKNTGHLSDYERRWLLDFFPSKQKYIYVASAIRSIVVVESDVKYTASSLPSNYTLKYRFSDTSIYLNLVRNENIIPDNIAIPDINSPDFFLPPRLAEYPRLQLSEGVILPAFDPNSPDPGTVTFGMILSAISDFFGGTMGGGEKDKHFQQYIAMPSKIWTITHGLGKHPSVTVINNDNQIVEGSVTYIDNNTIQIDFSAEFSGTVYCN